MGCNHRLEQDIPLGANVLAASLPSPLARRVEQTIASVGGASVGEVLKTGRLWRMLQAGRAWSPITISKGCAAPC